MNILIITQMYSEPDDTGDNKPTKTVNYFAKEWFADGHKVVVIHCSSKFPILFYMIPKLIKNKISMYTSKIIPSLDSRRKIHWNENGVEVYRIPLLKLYPGQAYSTVKLNMTSERIRELLDSSRFAPDVVAGHFANPSAELVANVSEYYNAKSSIVFHNDCNPKNIVKYSLSKSIQRIDAIGARSIIEAEQIQEYLGLDNLPFVCYSGAPNDAVNTAEKICKKMNLQKGIKYIYVGSLIRRKHVDVVIKTFASQKKPNDILKIIGGGPEEKKLKKIVTDIGANESVVFTGRISREEVLQQMKEAQVFTLISDNEVYGMVYIEAMLQGCLVIASKGGGFDGIIVEGENGFICKPGDGRMLKSIYKRIQAMSEEERNRIGQNAINTAIHYSEKEVANRYLSDILNYQK